jgi:hypothetical protein
MCAIEVLGYIVCDNETLDEKRREMRGYATIHSTIVSNQGPSAPRVPHILSDFETLASHADLKIMRFLPEACHRNVQRHLPRGPIHRVHNSQGGLNLNGTI